MDDNGMRTAPVEARQEPGVRHAYGTSSEWLPERLSQQRPRLRAVAYGCLQRRPQHLIR